MPRRSSRMMINPGTPRIQSRRGTIVASFRRATMQPHR
jgi:hypothetical protein